MTWSVLANDNAWTLPYLAEKRNVYWDSKTVRTINGQPLTLTGSSGSYGSGEGWLPASTRRGASRSLV